MFKLEIETDNAAFEGDPRPEIARILANVAHTLPYVTGDARQGGTILDINGNSVGRYTLYEEPWCNHDAPYLASGDICECGEIVP